MNGIDLNGRDASKHPSRVVPEGDAAYEPPSPLPAFSSSPFSSSNRRPSRDHLLHGGKYSAKRKGSTTINEFESKVITRFMSLEVEMKRNHNLLIKKLDTILVQGSGLVSGNASAFRQAQSRSSDDGASDAEVDYPSSQDDGETLAPTLGDMDGISIAHSPRQSRSLSRKNTDGFTHLDCPSGDNDNDTSKSPIAGRRRQSHRKMTITSSHTAGSSQTSGSFQPPQARASGGSFIVDDDGSLLPAQQARRPSCVSNNSFYSDRIAILQGRRPHQPEPPSPEIIVVKESSPKEVTVTKWRSRPSMQSKEEMEFASVLSEAKCSEEGRKRANSLFIENRPSRVALATWNFLDNPESSRYAQIYASIVPLIVAVAVLFSLIQTVEPSPFSRSACWAVDMLFDAMFSVEILVRYVVSPGRCVVFLLQPFNLIDIVPVLALLFRLAALVPDFPEVDQEMGFVCVVAVFRLLKTMRRFQQIHLLKGAFQVAWEALPVLMFMLAVMTLVFSSAVYLVEPRDNFDSLPRAIWFTMVTMTTVGYGDMVPETAAGTCIVFVLTIVSVLYMAVPLGIVGQAFKHVWADRDRILLMAKTQTALGQWGYTANDIPLVFSIFDSQGEGELCLTDFRKMINQMRIGLSNARIAELFQSFDKDGTGYVDDKEFVRCVFPMAYNDLYFDAYEDVDPQFATAVKNQKCDCGATLIPGGHYCGVCGKRVVHSSSTVGSRSATTPPERRSTGSAGSIGCRG